MFHLLRCISCGSELRQQNDSLQCLGCNSSYKLIDDIPDMMPRCPDEKIQEKVGEWANVDYDYDASLTLTPIKRLRVIDEPLLAQVRGLVLEIGCGTARLAKRVEQRGGKYIGIDPSLPLLKQGRDKGINTLVRGVGEYLPFPPNCFDTIIGGFHSFRYINLEKAYHECARVLKPGGMLAFTLWNYWSLCLDTLTQNVLARHAPWSNLPSRHAYSDVVWFPKEVRRLQRFGFKVFPVVSTIRLPVFNRLIGWRGYWKGNIGTLIGHDIVIVCQKTRELS